MLTGNVVIYLFGLLWLHHWLGAHNLGNSWDTTLKDGLYPFVLTHPMVSLGIPFPVGWR